MSEDWLPETGHWGEDGRLIIRQTQDVEPILERNKRLYNAHDGWSKSREMRCAASIPFATVDQWRAEGFDILDPNNKEAFLRRLDDPEFKRLRTAPGRLSRLRPRLPGRASAILDPKGRPYRMVNLP